MNLNFSDETLEKIKKTSNIHSLNLTSFFKKKLKLKN